MPEIHWHKKSSCVNTKFPCAAIVFFVLGGRGRAGVESEDLAQEVFIKALKHITSFRGDSSLKTWLFKIAKNHCLDFLTKENKRAKVLGADYDTAEAVVSEQFNSQSRVEELNALLASLSDLDKTEKSMFLLKEVEGLSYAEIAEVMECSIESVRARLKRARKSLVELKKQ